MKRIRLFLAVLAGVAGSAGGANSAALDYNLTAMSGSWAWGNTEWLASESLGYVNDSSDISKVNGILKGPYSFQPIGSPIANGIYNWPSGTSSLTFSTAGGVNEILSGLTILSSRSYASSTTVALDYSADGGTSWNNTLTTTTGALGWVDVGTGETATESITLNFGNVTGDEFRLDFTGGQISIHSLYLDGSGGAAPVPEPGTMMLLGAGFLGLAIYGKRRKNA